MKTGVIRYQITRIVSKFGATSTSDNDTKQHRLNPRPFASHLACGGTEQHRGAARESFLEGIDLGNIPSGRGENSAVVGGRFEGKFTSSGDRSDGFTSPKETLYDQFASLACALVYGACMIEGT